ncbi:nucleotidyltransferase family protein [Sphingomonas lutea]|uniref:Nucleotidyltransferase family protein n=1 Tax=Sphingomonas lutea TaxID=1045317 RepID=A0A7G9SHV1_9SPHN|nr:nucleotidyltransferase family protein [Sphingomonas lutea]QNN67426.1 nucleotidyltransferase family protein [Sphingomonas lutea]
MTHNAIVLAGSRPGTDPFAQKYGAELKALIPIAGEPMLARPVQALLASKCIGKVIVLAQEPDRLRSALPGDARVELRPSGATIATTIRALCDDPATPWPLLITTADHALLEPAMVEEMCAAADDVDVAIGVVERRALMRRLPGTRRTWIRLRGGAYTGANLFALRSPAVAPAIELWRSVEQDRKKGWRIVSAIGPGTLIGAALRLLTLNDALDRAGRRVGLTFKAVRLDNPLAGVDVDKPEDHALVEAILAGKA